MLEQLRRNSRSWLIWLIFAILIAAFVLFFGPQSQGPEMFGCGVQSSTVAEVDDEEIKVASWRFGMIALGGGSGGGSSAQSIARRSQVIDLLVEREILAAEARRLGMRVSEDLVLDHIKRGEIYMLGTKVDGKRIYFVDEFFNLRNLKLTVQNWGLSLDAFVSEQRQEILANLTRDTMIKASQASLEEARTRFVASNTTVTLDYVSFPVAKYAAALNLESSHVESFLASNIDDVTKAWEAEKAQFASEKDRVQVRILMVNKDAPPTPPVPTPTETPETPEAVDPPTEAPMVLENKKMVDGLLAKLKEGADFAEITRDSSDDLRSKKRGGLLDWRSADALGYGTAVVEAVKKLEVGGMTDVIEGPRGYYIARLEARSDKALGFDDRKADIAYRLAAKHYAEKLAAVDAHAALASLSEGKTLEELFERKAAAPFKPGQGLENLPPELRKQIEDMQKLQNIQPKPQPGAPAAPPAASPPDESGKQGWIIRTGPVQYAQTGGTTVAAPEGPSSAAPTDENLPTVTVKPPELDKLGPLSRPADKLAGVGRSKELITDLFDNLEEGQVATKLYSVTEPDALVIVQLNKRTEADLDQFKEDATRMREQMALAKGFETVFAFVTRRCQELAKSGDIGINGDYLIYDQDKPPIKYSACTHITERSVAQQFQSRYPSFFGM